MRLLINLRAAKNQGYESLYHHKLQGFVYGLLRDSGFGGLHDKRGYKFFCFSNIFPIKDMNAAEAFNLIISAPNAELISSVEGALENILADAEGNGRDTNVNIGEMSFEVVGFKKLETKLKRKNLRVLTATSVIIRIPERNYERYGIPEDERKARYVYWRPKYSFEAFLKQLSENLIKKFNDFYGTKLREYELFEQFMFRRTTATKVVIDGKEYVMVGSMWEFVWSYMDEMQRRVIEFGLDAGFGERNSLGFGFVNKISLRKNK
ncbi:MAG: CRISPR-associated endoribonuclease Cas6 [Methanophagales archaeon]|nr:CRISPR-associated endoribonuclease Cas6 [Methanophagales archaeon]